MSKGAFPSLFDLGLIAGLLSLVALTGCTSGGAVKFSSPASIQLEALPEPPADKIREPIASMVSIAEPTMPEAVASSLEQPLAPRDNIQEFIKNVIDDPVPQTLFSSEPALPAVAMFSPINPVVAFGPKASDIVMPPSLTPKPQLPEPEPEPELPAAKEDAPVAAPTGPMEATVVDDHHIVVAKAPWQKVEAEVDPCSSPAYREEDFTVKPEVATRANIVLVIDDSGSMTNKIRSVMSKIVPFVTAVAKATSDQFKLHLVYDYSKTGIRELKQGNPFASLIDGQRIIYHKEETFSHWGDIAVFKAFANPNEFGLEVPQEWPLDIAPTSKEKRAATAGDCTGQGVYFRPRAFQNPDVPHKGATRPTYREMDTIFCFGSFQKASIRDQFYSDLPVHVVLFSDDDINPAGSVVPHDMLRELFRPLGAETPYIFHSVVETEKHEPPFERLGANASDLARDTGGQIESIRSPDYKTIFDKLEKQMFFQKTKHELACPLRSDHPVELTIEDKLITKDELVLEMGKKQIVVQPSAFENDWRDLELRAHIRY